MSMIKVFGNGNVFDSPSIVGSWKLGFRANLLANKSHPKFGFP